MTGGRVGEGLEYRKCGHAPGRPQHVPPAEAAREDLAAARAAAEFVQLRHDVPPLQVVKSGLQPRIIRPKGVLSNFIRRSSPTATGLEAPRLATSLHVNHLLCHAAVDGKVCSRHKSRALAVEQPADDFGDVFRPPNATRRVL